MSRSGLRGGVARPDDDGFIDVICADEELLREEFESIIAAAWSDAPPSTGPQRRSATKPWHQPRSMQSGRRRRSPKWIRERHPRMGE
jgi:hypothetical protein